MKSFDHPLLPASRVAGAACADDGARPPDRMRARRHLERAARRVGTAVAIAACLSAHAGPDKGSALQGVVTQVVDGANVRFTPLGQAAITVHVRDIEVPESCQPGAPEAKAALAVLALNKTVALRPSGRDAQGRTLGVLLVDDVNIGRRMVEDGHAWSVRTRNDNGPLVKQERMAKALGRGLHAIPGSVPPREWRRTRGLCPPNSP